MSVMVNTKMYYWTPQKIKELKQRGYKLTSSQAGGGKHPNQRSRVQASSQNSQAPGSRDQGTSAQAHVSGRKQQE